MLGSVLHLFMFCKALVLNGKSCHRRGPEKKAKSFFVCLLKRTASRKCEAMMAAAEFYLNT